MLTLSKSSNRYLVVVQHSNFEEVHFQGGKLVLTNLGSISIVCIFLGYFQMEGIELTVQGYHGEFHLVFFLIISNMFVV